MSRFDDWLTREPDYLDPGHWRTSEDRDEPSYAPICDECGRTINFGLISLQGVGIACSHKCMNRLCLKHEAAMTDRG